MHISLKPEAPSERLGRPVCAELERLILDCLPKHPEQRPASAEDLVQRLRKLPVGARELPQARAWWAERGAAIEAKVRSERRATTDKAQGLTLAIDRRDVDSDNPT